MAISKLSTCTLNNGFLKNNYSDAIFATGGTIYEANGYVYHKFTSDGTFTPLSPIIAEILVIGGGGAGGQGDNGSEGGGGGGAGGVVMHSSQSLQANFPYKIVVGTGGPGGGSAGAGEATGAYGNKSQFGSLTPALGGGGGGSGANSTSNKGGRGASGGGAGRSGLAGVAEISLGYQGTNGGAATAAGGGGGGVTAGGNGASGSVGGAGGNGTNFYTQWASDTSSGVYDGIQYYFAGGGGGGGAGTTSGAGGAGGGGAGGDASTFVGSPGVANTGSGGGGGRGGTGVGRVGGDGGSGIVIVKYPISKITNSIVSSGLFTYLDPGDTSSYSGSGTSYLDLSGNSRNATLVNSPLHGTNPYGYFEIQGDGPNQFIDMGTSANFTGAFTASIWLNSSFPSGFQYFLNRWTYSPGDKRQWSIDTAGVQNTINFRLSSDGTDAGQQYCQHQDAAYINNWVHVAATWDASVMRLYVNGLLKASANKTGIVNTSGFNTYIGGGNIGSDANATAKIGPVALYNRALSLAEVQQNFETHRHRYGA
jgi:hypothetical protein